MILNITTIQLKKGMKVYLDKEDWKSLPKTGWHIFPGNNGKLYVVRTCKVNGRKTMVRMHRLIMGAKSGQIVDHINGNPLDNRRSNLRFVTNSQNMANRTKNRETSSIFKGVSRRNNKWVAQIQKDGKKEYLGLFSSQFEAAKAYNKAAKKLFGKYALLNDFNSQQGA